MAGLWDALAQTWPAKMGKGILDAVQLPGQVAGGLMAVTPETPGQWSEVDEYKQQRAGNVIESRAKDLAGTLMMGGLSGAQQGAAGIFGGRLAATADQAALRKAEELAAKGAPREQIWNETGWFQGADKKWRFEIDDSKSVFRGVNPEPQETPIRAALQHPDLYKAYPDAVGIKAREVTNGVGDKTMGQYLGGEGDELINIGWSNPEKRSTMLHELQHAVQKREGFAPGGNVFGLRPDTPAWEIYQERLKAMKTPLDRPTYSKVAGYGDELASEAEYKKYLKVIKKPNAMADRDAQDYAVQSAYKRSAGEVEARNVQKRMDMTMDQRRAAPPWTTQDVSDEMQIIRGLLAP